LTLRIADLDDPQHDQDDMGTWLLAHRERLSFGTPYVAYDALVVDATLRVPCKYLAADGADPNAVECRAHGFRGTIRSPRRPTEPPLRHGECHFTVQDAGVLRPIELLPPPSHRRSLPVLAGSNPCATAPCRTADNTRGAACCRDLTLDVVLPLSEERTESLLRARKAPYACKVTRTDEVTVECEVISACDYLEHDGIHCGLHGLRRPNGRQAKPALCFEFPDLEDKELVGHPGCVFLEGQGPG
jgi:hypothetical protein